MQRINELIETLILKLGGGIPYAYKVKHMDLGNITIWYQDRPIYHLISILKKKKKAYVPRYALLRFKTRSFDTFFDDANGREVWNMEQIKDNERAGQVMLSPTEASREFKRAKRYKDAKFMKKSRDLFLNKIVEVEKGYKYSEQFKNRENFSQENLRRHLERMENA